MEDYSRIQLLIKKCKKGDRRAFEEIMKIYQQKVFNFAYKLSLNYDDASEITVEVFYRVFKSVSGFRNEANFQSWMFTIVKNVYLDMIKAKKKHQCQSIDAEIQTENGDIQREIKDEKATPEEAFEENERKKHLIEIIDSLPEIQAIPIKMYHLEDMGYEEIAQILNIPLGTVKSRINRARKTLEEKLKDFMYN